MGSHLELIKEQQMVSNDGHYKGLEKVLPLFFLSFRFYLEYSSGRMFDWWASPGYLMAHLMCPLVA